MSSNFQAEKVDFLAFAAHPDDAELSAGGLIAKMVRLGHKVGIVDLTAGQMATRGSVESREEEAAQSSKILGLTVRENLGFEDGNLSSDDSQVKRRIVEVVRKYRPNVVLTGLTEDMHPDHWRGGELVSDAVWLAGRLKYQTGQERHQIKRLLFYPMHYIKEISFIVDISQDFQTKRRAVLAFSSQFYHPDSPDSNGAGTYVSSREFMEFWEAKARYFGGLIGKTYGEPYFMHEPAEIADPLALWS